MKIVKTQQFEDDQLHIEDHIYNSNECDIKFVDKFIDELDAAVQWVHSNTTTPKEDEIGLGRFTGIIAVGFDID